MDRRALTDGSGAWFDADKAERFDENTWWNGNNHISEATGSQFVHEAIFVTKGGKYILKHSSQFQGTPTTYEEISKEEAAQWFAKQNFSDAEIPEIFRSEVNSFEML